VYTRRTRFDPAAELRRLAAERPVTRIDVGPGDSEEFVWLVTGYDEVRQVLGDHVRFSTRRHFGRAPRTDGTSTADAARTDDHRPDDMVGQLMDYDPPEHTRLRKILTPEFTVRRIGRLRPRIEEIVAERLDAVERAGPPADLVEQFATPVSGAVLCELIGVPRDDRGAFLRRARHHLDQGRGRQARATAGAAFSRYLADLVAARRRNPDDGFLGMLVRDHGACVTDKELRGVCVLLLLAGLDNVSGMLSLGTLVLLEHPDQLAAVRADPEAMDRTVDELLRYLTVPHAPTPRTALADVTVGGQFIAAGEHVVVSLPMANRDPALTAAPERFDHAREPSPHIAFGHGIHHCLGAALARLELGIGYAALLRRFPHLRLAAPAAQVQFRPHTTAYGLGRLPVAW
jgi:oxidation protein CepF/oxidation protein CepG